LTEPLIVTTTPRENHLIGMTIQLGPERTAQAIHRAARAVAGKARIPGFRPGKAPDATVLRTYGREAVLREIMDDLGEEVFKEALETEKIEPFGQASLEDIKTDPITFSLVVPLRPTVELGDYRSIHIDAPTVNVTEADVEALIEQAREARAAMGPVERAAQIGDTVVVDITGTVDEDTIMDNHDWELALKGEGGWLPGFDESFVGMSAGDEKEFTLTYPEDSASRYKGRPAAFHARVSTVKAQVKPELDDEFAKSLGSYENVTDMRAKLLERLTESRQAEAEGQLTDQAVQALIDGATIAYPPNAVDVEVDDALHDIEHRVNNSGYKLEDYLRLQGMTVQSYRQQLRPQAEQRFKGRLVLGELAQQEKIEVSADEIEAEVDRLVTLAGNDEEAQSTRDLFGSETGRAVIRQDQLTKKTLARLREIVTTSAATGPAPIPAEASPAQDSETVIAATDVAPAEPIAAEPVAGLEEASTATA
jgi:trigger factor